MLVMDRVRHAAIHPSAMTARSGPKQCSQNIQKNRCRTTVAEPIGETLAELPFTGDQAVCLGLGHDQAAWSGPERQPPMLTSRSRSWRATESPASASSCWQRSSRARPAVRCVRSRLFNGRRRPCNQLGSSSRHSAASGSYRTNALYRSTAARMFAIVSRRSRSASAASARRSAASTARWSCKPWCARSEASNTRRT